MVADPWPGMFYTWQIDDPQSYLPPSRRFPPPWYNEAKRQAAFSWLSEQVQLRDRREQNAELAWRALFASMAAALIGIMATLMALR